MISSENAKIEPSTESAPEGYTFQPSPAFKLAFQTGLAMVITYAISLSMMLSAVMPYLSPALLLLPIAASVVPAGAIHMLIMPHLVGFPELA